MKYQKLIEEYTPQIDKQVMVYAGQRRFDSCGHYISEECFVGELLEVKPNGLCIAADNDDGEIFVPFSMIRWSEKRYLLAPDFDDMKLSDAQRKQLDDETQALRNSCPTLFGHLQNSDL